MIENGILAPAISKGFTLEDIRKIREWHYKRRKNANIEEIIADIKKSQPTDKKNGND
jgi:hypothetical protein